VSDPEERARHLALAAEEKRFHVIDGMKSIEVIQQLIWDTVRSKLGERVAT